MSRLVLALLHAFGDDAGSMREAADRLSHSLGDRLALTVLLEGERREGDGRAWTSYASDDPREIARARRRVARELVPLLGRTRKAALFGFSQGAMIALEVAFSTDLAPVGVVGVGSFLAPGGLARGARARKRPRVLLLHGRADEDVPAREAERVLERLRELGAKAELALFPDARHEITRPMLTRVAGFFRGLS
ncbi:prolyl oligopeptidase family serine peptidase [bacterium]|nr:prolyl oligopeptidase family serine peptidase [bacterium]